MIGPDGIPTNTPIERWRQRRFVVRQHMRDMADQRRLGLDTFPKDWTLLAGASSGTPPPKTIWMLWLQGEADAPPLIQRAIESWRSKNPGWRVEVLDAEKVHAWIDMPRCPEGTRPNHIADIIRLRLLEQYGGVWTDATTLCLRPLDDWIGRTLDGGMFAFARPQPVRSLANWFIASHPGATLTRAWRTWSEIYLLSGRKPASYFWAHHTFDWLVSRSAQLSEEWARTPKVSARGPHIGQRILDRNLAESDLPACEDLCGIPLLKLNWKKGYAEIAVHQLLDAYFDPKLHT